MSRRTKNEKGKGRGGMERRTIDRIFRPRHAKYLELMFEPSLRLAWSFGFIAGWRRPLTCLGDKGSWRAVLLPQPSFQLPGNSRRRPFNFTSPVHAASRLPPVFPPRTMLNDKFSNIRLKPAVFPPSPWNSSFFCPEIPRSYPSCFPNLVRGSCARFLDGFEFVVLTGTSIGVNCGGE